MGILNLTGVKATPEQIAQGVVDPPKMVGCKVKELLTFKDKPDWPMMEKRAKGLAEIAKQLSYSTVMIGGAPYFMSCLEEQLKQAGLCYCYSFKKRLLIEKAENGAVKRYYELKHIGFV